MAKLSESKNEIKKLQKEVAALKNKLKAAEKKIKDSQKVWEKKHQSYQKEMEKKLEAAHQEGYQVAVGELEKKDIARKKALHSAEAAFEKEYRKKSQMKTLKKAPKAKAKAKKEPRASKLTKTTRASAKTTSDRANVKRRGRPPKQEKMKLEHHHANNMDEASTTQHETENG